MRRTPWIVYMWPGLPQIWQQGSWFGLVIAVAAAGVLNFALLAGFGFSELVAGNVRMGLWAAVGVVWVVSAAISYVWVRRQARLQKKRFRRRADREATPDEATFSRATEKYLKGDWFEAERLWGVLLKANSRDLDARLMLATLYRHTKRLDEAAEQLTMLERFEGAEAWELEIRRERELLLELRENTLEETEQETSSSPNSADPPADEIRAA
ncbi:MAG: hypothetical protein V3R99_14105 [Thermoguttaceae bacterium]